MEIVKIHSAYLDGYYYYINENEKFKFLGTRHKKDKFIRDTANFVVLKSELLAIDCVTPQEAHEIKLHLSHNKI